MRKQRDGECWGVKSREAIIHHTDDEVVSAGNRTTSCCPIREGSPEPRGRHFHCRTGKSPADPRVGGLPLVVAMTSHLFAWTPSLPNNDGDAESEIELTVGRCETVSRISVVGGACPSRWSPEWQSYKRRLHVALLWWWRLEDEGWISRYQQAVPEVIRTCRHLASSCPFCLLSQTLPWYLGTFLSFGASQLLLVLNSDSFLDRLPLPASQ